MKTLPIALVFFLLLSSAAFACVDPDPDQMGVYFDSGAQTYCVPLTWDRGVDVNVIYTRPTIETFQGFEFGLTIDFPDGMWYWNWPSGWYPGAPQMDNIIYFLEEPLATDTATVLMCARLTYYDPDNNPLFIYLHGARENTTGDPGLPGIYYCPEPGTDLTTLPVGVSGGVGQVTAQINGDCLVVDSESTTWGGVKSLYR